MRDPRINIAYKDLGEVVVSWNHLEWQLTELVCCFGDPRTAQILTAHMKTNSLCDALRSFAADSDADVKQALEHGLLVFERLREYRNHFVHRTTCFVPIGGEEGPWAFTYSISARKGLRVEHSEYSHTQLLEFQGWLEQLSNYLQELTRALKARIEPNAELAQSFAPWPQKLPVPDTPANALRGHPTLQPRPQS